MLGFANITCIFSRLQTNIISLFSKIVILLTLQCSTKGEYILEELHVEMVLAMHIQESSQSAMEKDNFVSSGDATQCLDNKHHNENQDYNYFIGKVIHPFDAQADGELSLNVDEYVVVRKVSPNGWSEGECNGKTGWFPSAYLEGQEVKKTRQRQMQVLIALLWNSM